VAADSVLQLARARVNTGTVTPVRHHPHATLANANIVVIAEAKIDSARLGIQLQTAHI